eukprot:6260609-Ditylum_brightwellii.AAC.1
MQVPRPSRGHKHHVIEWDKTSTPQWVSLQSHPLTTHIEPTPHNKLLLQVAISKSKTAGFKFKTQYKKRRQDAPTKIATEGSSSASTSSCTRSTHRGIPLVAGLKRHVKRSRHATVQDNDPEESDSNGGDNLDKDDNAYTDLNNAALDKEDGIDDSDNFYKSILSDEWE